MNSHLHIFVQQDTTSLDTEGSVYLVLASFDHRGASSGDYWEWIEGTQSCGFKFFVGICDVDGRLTSRSFLDLWSSRGGFVLVLISLSQVTMTSFDYILSDQRFSDSVLVIP